MNRIAAEGDGPSAMAAVGAMWPETESLVELLFDSFSHPCPVSTRSGATRRRQMLYRAEPYQIDLQVEPDLDNNRLIVTGQLLDVSHPEMLGHDIQVTLSNLCGDVLRTEANQFGEFRGEVEDSGNLELTFVGRSKKTIIVLLRDVLE